MLHFFICSKKLTSRCLFFTRFSDNHAEQAIGSQVTPREPGRSRDITMHALVLSLLDVLSVPHKRLSCLFAITSCLAFPWWSRCKNTEGVLVTVSIRKGQLFYFMNLTSSVISPQYRVYSNHTNLATVNSLTRLGCPYLVGTVTLPLSLVQNMPLFPWCGQQKNTLFYNFNDIFPAYCCSLSVFAVEFLPKHLRNV